MSIWWQGGERGRRGGGGHKNQLSVRFYQTILKKHIFLLFFFSSWNRHLAKQVGSMGHTRQGLQLPWIMSPLRTSQRESLGHHTACILYETTPKFTQNPCRCFHNLWWPSYREILLYFYRSWLIQRLSSPWAITGYMTAMISTMLRERNNYYLPWETKKQSLWEAK